MSADLTGIYRAYIDCLNRRAWDELGRFVHDDVVHNGRALGLAGYRGMLEEDVRRIPDLRFAVEVLVCDAATAAARLLFDCTPSGEFLGLAVDGRRIRFAEHVFYRFEGGRIETVWSILDRAAIELQLG
jgi:predicted ester cyclase